MPFFVLLILWRTKYYVLRNKDWLSKQINESINQIMKQSVIEMINQSMKLFFFFPNLWCRATGNVQPAAIRERKTHICWIVIYRVDNVIQSLNNQALGNKQVSLKWKISCLSPVRSESYNLNHWIWTCFRSQLSCLVIVWLWFYAMWNYKTTLNCVRKNKWALLLHLSTWLENKQQFSGDKIIFAI